MRKIHYIDDDRDDIETFISAVQKIEEENDSKIDVKVYPEGIGLLHELNNIEPDKDLVFLDINMPFKSGFEILTEIRRYTKLCKLPIIMYSTAYDRRSISISQDLGANLYAIKPYSINNIKSLIKYVAEIEWDNFEFVCLNWREKTNNSKMY